MSSIATINYVEPRHVEDVNDCFFYHTMTLPGLGEVRGQWDLRERFDEYVGGVELKGKSVIDIGAATGYLSFEAEKRGAIRVLSFDIAEARNQHFLPFKDKLHFRSPNQWTDVYGAEIERWKNAYWLCHRLLNSRAQTFYGSIYDLPITLGSFDVAIVGSVLEHLSDPINALASIARLTRETMVVVTPLFESEERVARFEGRADTPENDFTWWTYSTALYREVFSMLGFSIKSTTSAEYFYHYRERLEPRHTIVAEREKFSALST